MTDDTLVSLTTIDDSFLIYFVGPIKPTCRHRLISQDQHLLQSVANGIFFLSLSLTHADASARSRAQCSASVRDVHIVARFASSHACPLVA